MANSIFKRNNGWSNQKIEVKNGSDINVAPTYKRTSSGWERLDQQLVTQTKIIEGYAQWNGSFRSDSASGNATYFDPALYQGKYSSGYKEYKIGLMCFSDLFKKARELGTIKKVELRLKNNHAYYNSGLKTRICGAWSLPSTRPSTANYSWSDTNAYTGDWSFPKNGSAPQWITLNSNIHSKIQNSNINGLRVLSPSGYTTNDYGYFEGSNSNRPYIKITVEYQA